jgi:adenylate kinase
MLNLILFGPPGSGKGTQSAKLIQRYGLQHISTGDLLREETANGTSLGLEAKNYMDQGQLVPDAVVIGMIGSRLDAQTESAGFIFDGFPRTSAQAAALDELLRQKNTKIDLLLSLEVPEDELKRRLIHRGELSGRSDDNEEIIEKRILEYKAKTEPVAAYYAQQNKLVRIKGDGDIDATFQLLEKEIDQLINTP